MAGVGCTWRSAALRSFSFSFSQWRTSASLYRRLMAFLFWKYTNIKPPHMRLHNCAKPMSMVTPYCIETQKKCPEPHEARAVGGSHIAERMHQRAAGAPAASDGALSNQQKEQRQRGAVADAPPSCCALWRSSSSQLCTLQHTAAPEGEGGTRRVG